MEIKLEVETSKIVRVYGDTKWTFDKGKLVEIVPCEHVTIPTEFTLNPGYNIRLNGEEYHVVSHEIIRSLEEQKVYFIYEIKKGRYIPPKWLVIGKIEIVEANMPKMRRKF